MAKTDPRVDEYIAKSADFAQPILIRLREIVHVTCPEVEETIKWGFPHFMYHGILCSMAAFKAHCAFGFWKGSLILPSDAKSKQAGQAMGHFGKIVSIADLPPKKTLTTYIKQAMKLNEDGVKMPSREKTRTKKEVIVPDDFISALKRKKGAAANFDAFSPSHKREYIQWIEEAKTEETRKRRLETALEWITEGKQRNWRYVK